MMYAIWRFLFIIVLYMNTCGGLSMQLKYEWDHPGTHVSEIETGAAQEKYVENFLKEFEAHEAKEWDHTTGEGGSLEYEPEEEEEEEEEEDEEEAEKEGEGEEGEEGEGEGEGKEGEEEGESKREHQ